MWFVDPINEPHRLDHFKEMHSEVDHVFCYNGRPAFTESI